MKSAINALVKKAQKDESILAVMLFGSHARKEARPDSDEDICLFLRPGNSEKENSFAKRLEYAGDFDVDVHIYQDVPLYIRQRILKEGKVLFCRDEELLCEIACKTITEFADFEHIYRDYLKEIARG